MSTKDNGGAAFPSLDKSRHDERDGTIEHFSEGGMTLRDYFAASAPIDTADAMLACGVTASYLGMLGQSRRVEVLAKLAEMRGEYADAMLAERAK